MGARKVIKGFVEALFSSFYGPEVPAIGKVCHLRQYTTRSLSCRSLYMN